MAEPQTECDAEISFVARWAGAWRGRLRPPPKGDDPRYEYLARKYGLDGCDGDA